MKKVIFAWIGTADLRAAQGGAEAGLGPIGQALAQFPYETAVLLSDHDRKATDAYLKWAAKQTRTALECVRIKLSSPTHFGEIYEQAIQTLQEFHKRTRGSCQSVFHLSPGTPAMAAVWIIIAKTRFPAELIQSSREMGVQVASVPFDISADYLPDLLRTPDAELVRLSQGLPPEAPEYDAIIHRSDAMKRLIARARRVAPRTIPVLLLGESGTGKELFARAIHHAGTARPEIFVTVNCGAIPRELVESELFGHVKGAFTGAVADKKGYLERANNGTLFLDEVGELPAEMQVKLLRVLQDGEVMPVGGTRSRKVTFRLIAATNRNLLNEVVENRFREDLFHRIAVAVLTIPPLRERREDIPLLLDALLDVINQEAQHQPGYRNKKLSVNARKFMVSQPWPGNVRELQNTLQRAAVWAVGDTIDLQDVQGAYLPMPAAKDADILGKPLGNGLNLPDILDSVTRHYLARAMEEAHGNKTQAAELLGLPSYQTLTNWLKRHELEKG